MQPKKEAARSRCRCSPYGARPSWPPPVAPATLQRKIASSVGIAEIVLLQRKQGVWIVLAAGDLSLAAIARAERHFDDGTFFTDLASRVAGWTAHPYGPRAVWQALLDQLVAETQARGAPVTVPIYITELGIASDDGHCLNNNFGWNPCLSYAETGAALASTVTAIRARYGTRIRAIFVFQALDQRLPHLDSNREHYFGILTANGRPKGALTKDFRALLRSQH